MQSEAEKRQTNRDITKRFVAVMYQCIGNQRVRTKKEFGEYAGVASSNLNRMENEETMNVPLYAIKNVGRARPAHCLPVDSGFLAALAVH